MRALDGSSLRVIGSVASSLALAGPDKGSILEFFELMSVWAETAHSQLPTPRGFWQGLISGSKGDLEPAIRGASEATVGGPWSPLVPRNSPVAG